MKWIIDSHIKHEDNKTLLVNRYFCLLDRKCILGYTKHSEVICRNERTTSSSSIDTFISPINSQENKYVDTSFVPPIKDDSIEDISYPSNSEVTKYGIQNILLLFVKADSGNNIISALKSKMKLSPIYFDNLYLETMNLWVGSKKQFDENIVSDFSLADSKGEIPKLDFVIIQIQLCDNFSGYQKGASSIDRMNFLKHICDKELSIARFSNRLNFENSKGASFSWEK